ncbi:MAG: hypothetical protein IR160_06730 [Salinibacterium sp.]|nr:hypothetical protein [Salinibacterium sp.]MBF0672261.1 hypothetical protein [Salinibacterium sp.]
MAGDLTVFGGGTTRVATEELSANATRLRDFARATQGIRMRLAMLDGAINPGLLAAIDAPMSAARANETVDDCLTALWFSSLGAEALAMALDAAAGAYGMADAASDAILRSMAGRIAHTVGLLWPFALAASTPLALFAFGAWQSASETQRQDALTWVTSHRGLLSDPRFVEFVRLAVSSADEFGAGVAGIPWEVTALLGDEALGILGFSTTVATVTGIARMTGHLSETPVKVEARKAQTTEPASSFEELAGRVPDGEEQIRIERVAVPDGPDSYFVYLGGTRDGSLLTGGEAFDMASNLGALADDSRFEMGDAGSKRALHAAMLAAGIGPENPVAFIGYSQGAAVALDSANDGIFNVKAVYSLGGPTGEITVPDGVAYLALEHEEDIVPAVGGVHRDRDTIVVRASSFDGAEPEGNAPLPAHDLGRYRETSAHLDSAHDQRVRDFGGNLHGMLAGATAVESQLWHARRVAP